MKNEASLSKFLIETEKAAQEIVGFEYEHEDEDSVDEKPYNPDDIRITQKFFSVSDVCRWMSSNPPTITIKPEFQRNFVWSERKKSLLIESLMLRIPVPSFYLYEDSDEHKSVIDGLQRLSTIHDYVSGEFVLCNLQYLGDSCNGKKFSELDQKYRTRIEDTQLNINILDANSPEQVKFDVFTRINTGGVPLNRQEIRNALANTSTMKLMKRMATSESFLLATHGVVKDVRMDAQELCIRFIAFFNAYDPREKILMKNKTISNMLDTCIQHLNTCNQQTLDEYFTSFEASMRKAAAALGKMAFIKPTERIIINKPLFTSWAVTLAYSDYSISCLEENQNKLMNKYKELLFSDSEYFNSISTSTGTKKNIDIQFASVLRVLEVLEND